MTLFVDTNVWSLAFRWDAPIAASERRDLVRAIEAGEEIVTTGLVVQELLQGFSGPRNRAQILERFAALPPDAVILFAVGRPVRPHPRMFKEQLGKGIERARPSIIGRSRFGEEMRRVIDAPGAQRNSTVSARARAA